MIRKDLIYCTIRTAQGEALYSHTEVEDKNGNWNDEWLVSNGEWVIHDGKQHHVFIVPKKEVG